MRAGKTDQKMTNKISAQDENLSIGLNLLGTFAPQGPKCEARGWKTELLWKLGYATWISFSPLGLNLISRFLIS